jgi:hypothetical protein
VQVVEELDNRLKEETKRGWKDNTTSVLKKELQQYQEEERTLGLSTNKPRSDIYIYGIVI